MGDIEEVREGEIYIGEGGEKSCDVLCFFFFFPLSNMF
jgi:hypothetical protein